MSQQQTGPARSGAHQPQMRVYLAMSLDGYIADAQGGVAWLNDYFTPEMDFDAFMDTIGVSVMGRRTYDQSLTMKPPDGFDDSRLVVITHRPLRDPRPGVEAHDGDPRELTQRLREELRGTGKDIWMMGGGESLAGFVDAGLIDRWEIAIIPIVLGDGIPLFPQRGARPSPLRLVHHERYSNGVMMLHYVPA